LNHPRAHDAHADFSLTAVGCISTINAIKSNNRRSWFRSHCSTPGAG
jgi:hypothetical protein